MGIKKQRNYLVIHLVNCNKKQPLLLHIPLVRYNMVYDYCRVVTGISSSGKSIGSRVGN